MEDKSLNNQVISWLSQTLESKKSIKSFPEALQLTLYFQSRILLLIFMTVSVLLHYH